MAAGVVETQTGRVYSKGTHLMVARQATPTSFSRVAGVVSIDGLNFTRETVDATELDPPSGTTVTPAPLDEVYYWKYKEPGDKEAETLNVTLNMNLAQYSVLNTIYSTDEHASWQLLFRNGTIFQWVGWIETLGMNLESNQLVKTPCGICPVGSGITYTPGT